MKQILTHLGENWIRYGFETLVVTISILGAFALNSWNESRKIGEEKIEFINNLITNYESNELQLSQKIKMHEAIVAAGFSLLEKFDNPENVNLDSVLLNLKTMGVDPTFDPTSLNLELTNKMNFVEQSELTLLLTNWTSDIIALREMELMNQNLIYNHYTPLLAKIGIYRDVATFMWDTEDFNHEWLLGRQRMLTREITRSGRRIDPDYILSNFELEGMIAESITLNQASLEQAYALQEKIQNTLALLEKEKEL